MARYLSVIPKQSFFSLFKFGYIPLFWQDLVPYSSKDDQEMHSALLEQFSNYAQIEFDEDYLIVLWNKEIKEEEKIVLELRDAERIVPLTRQAKISLTRKTGGKIHFSEPFFENIYAKLEVQNIESNGLRGSMAFWEIAGLPSSYRQVYDQNLLKNALELRLSGKHSFELQAQEFITHLFLYEGYEKFPRYCALGFIYDVIKILADWKGITQKAGEKAYSKTGSFQLLASKREELEKYNSLGLLKGLDNSEEAPIVKFKEALIQDNIKLWVVAFFFLEFKEEIREANTLTETKFFAKVKHYIKDGAYIPELEYAVYLLGYFFGFSKIYDEYYKFLNLYILTGNKEQSSRPKIVQESVKNSKSNRLLVSDDAKSDKEKEVINTTTTFSGDTNEKLKAPKEAIMEKLPVIVTQDSSVDSIKMVFNTADAAAAPEEPVEVKRVAELEVVNEREVVFTIERSHKIFTNEEEVDNEVAPALKLQADEQSVNTEDLNKEVLETTEPPHPVASTTKREDDTVNKDLAPNPSIDTNLNSKVETNKGIVTVAPCDELTERIVSFITEQLEQQAEIKLVELAKDLKKIDNELSSAKTVESFLLNLDRSPFELGSRKKSKFITKVKKASTPKPDETQLTLEITEPNP